MADGSDTIRRGRKFEQVLNGACDVFMKDGFEGASVDEIARTAGVSKATLYSYFPDKRLLFIEVIRLACSRQADEILEQIDTSRPARDVLKQAVHYLAQTIVSDLNIQLFRITVAEAQRFPDLAKEFYDSGPARGVAEIAAFLKTAVERREMNIDDVELAADQLVELCKSDIFARRVFGVCDHITEEEIMRVADGALETFWHRYGV